jgi:hypothetical protein
MAGLPWFELDVDFSDHPKCLALAAKLREPLAEAYVSRLWAYCYRHATDRLEGEAASEIVESAARWRGKPGVLVDALLVVRLLRREGPDLVVHGVAERLAPHLEKRTKDAERQRERRAKAAASIGDITRLSPRRPRDVGRT